MPRVSGPSNPKASPPGNKTVWVSPVVGGRGVFRRVAAFALLRLAPTEYASLSLRQRQTERLGRGVVAVRDGDGVVLISWRLLAHKPPNICFSIYRSTAQPGFSLGEGMAIPEP